MSDGYFIDAFGTDQFVKFNDEDSNQEVVQKNLSVITDMINALPKGITTLAFSESFPFFCKDLKSESILGFFEKELLTLGKLFKSKSIRPVVIFKNKDLGLANPDTETLDLTKYLIISICEFFDLCRMDYSSLVFIPYGDEYLCDYHKFQKNLASLPKYARHRIGILGTSNFESMVVASHQKLPWVYNANEVLNAGMMSKSYQSFFTFSLKPESRPVLLSDNKIDDHAIDCILSEIPKKKPRKKKVARSKDESTTTNATDVPRKAGKKIGRIKRNKS